MMLMRFICESADLNGHVDEMIKMDCSRAGGFLVSWYGNVDKVWIWGINPICMRFEAEFDHKSLLFYQICLGNLVTKVLF